jgi:two-component system chemotaxis response regulator CheB
MGIRVLIIDDSATMRAILKSHLSEELEIEVVGTASDAVEGRELIKRLNPDVITLDIEIPGMNGLAFLERIMRLRPTPVIVVSGFTQKGSAVTARALALGAVDCYAKEDLPGGLVFADTGKLADLIRQAAQVRFDKRSQAVPRLMATLPASHSGNTRLIAIGSSTGGVEALQVLLRDFPEGCPPTVIVQHVNARYTPAIARMLDTNSPAKVMVAESGMRALAGHVYLAPGCDQHMSVGGAGDFFIKLRKGHPVAGHVPSVDVLFQSAAKVAGAEAIGILLSGMGSDGAMGLLAMARAGAQTIAQDEASCVVFGMPRVAISLGAARVVAPIDRIAGHVFSKAA